MKAIKILQRVQKVSEREIFVLYHSTQKLRRVLIFGGFCLLNGQLVMKTRGAGSISAHDASEAASEMVPTPAPALSGWL